MIIILGMAGAGKSTQCRHLEADGHYQWFSVGQHLREIETGVQKAEMAHGKVLDDALVTPIVRDELARLGDTPEILLDGCPRTVGQAIWLASATETPHVKRVVHLVISDEVAMERLLKRGREDDSREAMMHRFAGYHRDIQPVLDEFRKMGITVDDVNAEKDEYEVLGQLKELLGV